MKYRIGIDVGSTTAKMVVVDETGRVVWSRYERHNAQVRELLAQYLAEVQRITGHAEVSVCVTGSVGMAVSEMLQAAFVQEVVAAAAYARERHPEAQALIDIGGEDSKVVLLAHPSPAQGEGAAGQRRGSTDLRMNGNCAGGTGAFIDQMAVLLGVGHQELNDLALQSSHLHTMAARCGVFAKTDVQNLVSRGVPKADIAASIFHSVAVQTITTLARGAQIEAPVLLCGGPLTFLPALRRAFANYMGIGEDRFIISEQSHLIPALGCASSSTALSGEGGAAPADKRTIADLQNLLHRAACSRFSLAGSGRGWLSPLFADEAELAVWQQEKQQSNIPTVDMRPREQVVLGIDSGSTTTKIVAARTDGSLLFAHYAPSLGNPVAAVADGLTRLEAEADAQGAQIEVVGSCSTGYGEELIKAAFSLDGGIIETMAHYRAARRLQPDVSFILDIGGQDMKAIFVEGGVVTRMELNEACSSGCGTFLQTFAESLGYGIGDFARMACTARHPCDLGTRCTVFMNSKIKQVLREGADVSDIAAGLAYSVVNNCLYKVLKLRDVQELGRHIVVQGGTMRNDAVVRALERVTGCAVVRSNMPEMMGAYGCALHAAEHRSAPRSLSMLMAAARYETCRSACAGCENRCQIVRYRFAGGGVYFSGNKCERIFSNNHTSQTRGRNIYAEKYRLLFDRTCPVSDGQSPLRSIGLPRILNMYENYPFWHRLLTDCGFRVVLSSESKMQSYERSLCTVMSDNICFPAKLVHSHIAELSAAGVERILMPYVVYEQKDPATATNSYNCPIVSGYSDVVRSAMSPQVPVDAPVINFGNRRLLRRQIAGYLQSLGVPSHTIRAAFAAALAAQDAYGQAIRQAAQSILDDSRQQGRLTILLAGRPYHTDPLIQHRLGEMIAAMGVNVVSEDLVRQRPDLPDGEIHGVRQWAYVNRIIKAAEWVARQGTDVQFVQMTSFGCGPDAFIQDEVRSLLRRRDKTLTLLKIDDVSHVGSLRLRVRSLLESLSETHPQPLPVRAESGGIQGESRASSLTAPLPRRAGQQGWPVILAPHISEFVTPLLSALGVWAGYDIEVLPPSDAVSARLGLQYANNEVCYPATLIVGDIIKALQSGRYAPDCIAVAMSQTGGQCRATNYAGLIRRAMVQAGFQDVPLITLGVTASTRQTASLRVSWRQMAPAVLSALLFADVMAKMYYSAVVRERAGQKGMAARLRDQFLQQAAESIRCRNTDRLLWLTTQAAREFNCITCDRVVPRVGIVGEIFLKFNHFAHQQLTDTLISRGIEVVPPLITPFFLQEFVNAERNKHLGLTDSKVPNVLIRMLYTMAYRRIRQFNASASHYRHFRPFADIRLTATAADGIVSPAAQAGEGWLLPAEIAELAESGVNHVLSLQPFGCIANHVVSKGIENAVRRRYPNLNLLSLDFDSGVSTVNVINRLLLFLDQVNAAPRTGQVAMTS